MGKKKLQKKKRKKPEALIDWRKLRNSLGLRLVKNHIEIKTRFIQRDADKAKGLNFETYKQ